VCCLLACASQHLINLPGMTGLDWAAGSKLIGLGAWGWGLARQEPIAVSHHHNITSARLHACAPSGQASLRCWRLAAGGWPVGLDKLDCSHLGMTRSWATRLRLHATIDIQFQSCRLLASGSGEHG
jgi:hypothetical protein